MTENYLVSETQYYTGNLTSQEPFLVYTDHATLHWILTQWHLTVCHIDLVMVHHNFNRVVKYILDFKNQVTEEMSYSADSWCKWCNSTALEGTVAREWFHEMKAGIIDNEWFWSSVHSSADPCPSLLPSTDSTTEHKSWMSVQWFYSEEIGQLGLHWGLEK